jgi:hypothetical protein
VRALSAFFVSISFVQAAAAQELPSAAVLEAQASSNVEEGTSGAVDRMVRARLDRLNVVRTTSGVSLDLSEVQLALGCAGETAECLAPVADELDARLLLIPHLDGVADRLVLTLTLFDREDGSLRRAVREATGENARTQILDAIDAQLREIFELPAAPRETTDPEEGPGEPAPEPQGPSLIPLFVGIGGLAVIGVGTGVGFAAMGAYDTYRDARPTTPDEVDRAQEDFASAESLAITADVLFAVGGAVAIAAAIWFIVEITSQRAPENTPGGPIAIAPFFDAHSVGLALRADWGWQ